MLNKLRLEYFRAAAEAGSIRTAAKRLNIAASAISRQINLLETELGGPLLERLQNGVHPTELGFLLLNYCHKLETLELAFKHEVDNYHKIAVGYLSLCVGEGFINAIVNQPLKEFNQRYKGISLGLDTGSTDQIINNLIKERAHIGVMYQGDANPDLHYWYSSNLPLVALMSPTHKLANHSGLLPLESITKQQLILWSKGHGVRQLVEDGFSAQNLDPYIMLETNSLAAIRHMVIIGTGITLLPACAASKEVKDGTMVAKAIDSEIFQIAKAHVVTKVGRNLSKSGIALLHYLGQWIQNFSKCAL